ncbi:UvrD-helicase domain-containing protein [Proteiniphilum sp.]|uniref:UvrD-helicase domain-containing protein n=1 Tax=Proteiniphilum sp. TaxID=1926877 RepID=UPI003328CF6E
MNFKDFLSAKKSLLIAPAGYGKTHTLAECIRHCPDNQKQLILTHTNAGVASILEKIKELEIDMKKCHVNTIAGFAQKYVLSLCETGKLLPQDDPLYFDFVTQKAIELFKLKSIKRIITSSYHGLFVDEYQDCNVNQHTMVLELADVLPTRILGDSIQGIFNFNGPLLDFNTDLQIFEYQTLLETPWRWKKRGNNNQLGECLKEIRDRLDSGEKEINLSRYDKKGLRYFTIKEGDIYDPKSDYRDYLSRIITNKRQQEHLNSLLILVPNVFNYSNINTRSTLRGKIDHTRQLILLEAIDEEEHYGLCRVIDRIIEHSDKNQIEIKQLRKSVLEPIFLKGEVNQWFNNNTLINKREPNRNKYHLLKEIVDSLTSEPSLTGFYTLLQFLKNGLKLKSNRIEMLNSVLRALNTANNEKTTAYQAMEIHKNRLRRVGRKVQGKYLGTTLLTKGLEFDTVVLLDADKFDCHKHFYVAITRACKQLIIFTKSPVLKFK